MHPWSWMVFGQGAFFGKGTSVLNGSIAVSIPSMFWEYNRNRRPSWAKVASKWWKAVGFADIALAERVCNISWKEEMETSLWYTEASKRSFPKDVRKGPLPGVSNIPAVDRKSGTIWEVSYAKWKQYLARIDVLPADTDIPAPTSAIILRLLCKTLRSRLSWILWVASSSPCCKLRCSVVRDFAVLLFLVGELVL